MHARVDLAFQAGHRVPVAKGPWFAGYRHGKAACSAFFPAVATMHFANPAVSSRIFHMEIYLLRHGEAVEPGAPGVKKDFDRSLTSEGKRAVERAARAMRLMCVAPDLLLTSPFIRAKQTADITARVLKVRDHVAVADELAPGASQRRLVNRLRAADPPPKSVLLVGHEPYLSELVSVLLTGKRCAVISLKKGGLCKLTTEKLRFGRCARLDWLLTPGQMRLMCGKKR